jgi:hypothetical protein
MTTFTDAQKEKAYTKLEAQINYTYSLIDTEQLSFNDALNQTAVKFSLKNRDKEMIAALYQGSDAQFVREVVPLADTPAKALQLMYDHCDQFGDGYYKTLTDPILRQVEKVLAAADAAAIS